MRFRDAPDGVPVALRVLTYGIAIAALGQGN